MINVRLVDSEQNLGAVGIGYIRIIRYLITSNNSITLFVGIIHKKEAIIGVVRVKGYAEQPLFKTFGTNQSFDVQEWVGIDGPILDDKYPAGLVYHKQAVTAIPGVGYKEGFGEA